MRSILLGPLATLAFVAAAPGLAAGTGIAEVTAAEDAYCHAVTGPDVKVLGDTLSDDLVYVHASGQAQNKRDYLKGTVDGGFLVRSARVIERKVEVYGTIAITQGVIGYDVGKAEHPARYIAIYRKEHGRWLLLKWQNTKISPPTP